MAQVTKLSVLGTPGRPQTFSPKTAAIAINFFKAQLKSLKNITQLKSLKDVSQIKYIT